jgi:hypothetical protein
MERLQHRTQGHPLSPQPRRPTRLLAEAQVRQMVAEEVIDAEEVLKDLDDG